jgi:hypothetical protein
MKSPTIPGKKHMIQLKRHANVFDFCKIPFIVSEHCDISNRYQKTGQVI